ncbi:MAG: hypothetical protein WCI94_21895 [Rhodospirillales bacterium]
MDQTAPHPARTEPPAPPQGRAGKAVPTCIAAILGVVRVLLGYGKLLDATLPDRGEHPRFPTLAAGFGTHDIGRILGHVQRGILRAMMLQKYLLARAAQGRDIAPTARPERAEAQDVEALEMNLRPQRGPRDTPRARRIDPDSPMHFSMPTLKELESQVRRRSVGRTVAEICLDLGIAPSTCDGGFWFELYEILVHFGGNFEHVFGVQQRRKTSFQKERNNRPGTWSSDWRDKTKEAVRELLGYLLGESPPRGPPMPQLLTSLP